MNHLLSPGSLSRVTLSSSAHSEVLAYGHNLRILKGVGNGEFQSPQTNLYMGMERLIPLISSFSIH